MLKNDWFDQHYRDAGFDTKEISHYVDVHGHS